MSRLSFALHWGLLVAGILLAAASFAGPPDAGSPGTATPIPQVTIEARRAALRQQLYAYVATITRSQRRDEALHRWNQRVCPAVVGLTKEEGEFILARLSQIARAAVVPLDGEQCQVNLAVVFTNDPVAVIAAWGKRRSALGVHAPPAAFARFASRRGPVRVWYNQSFGSPDSRALTPGSLQLGNRFQETPTGAQLTGSKMYVKALLAFSSVAVIVDARQTAGIGIGPLTDHIAMLAFADTDPEVPLGQAPTILRLFSARVANERLPTGLSDWDRAYLKALYGTKLDLITQRSVIAEEMVQDVAP
jgi:hypothetical protein